MSTRRSPRTRARGSDAERQDGGTNGTSSLVSRAAKCSRKNAQESVNQGDEKVSSVAWRHQILPETKRAAWDAVLKTHCFLHKPHDLYDVFELAVHFFPRNPLDAFVVTAGIRLSGPFDLLARRGTSIHPSKPLYLHGRFFHDPPEVVTVLEDTTSDSGAHWGLYRDKPSETPTYIVHTNDATVCAFEPVALTLFSVVHDRLQSSKADNADEQLRLVQSYLHEKGDAFVKPATAVRNQRFSEILASSLHGLGIVVPYNAKKRSGYRELPIVGDALRELITTVQTGDAAAKKKLTNLLTRATIANDECDFGTSLLLGLDLFTAGTALQKEALQMLGVAYMLVGRKDLSKVANEHTKHRVDGLHPLNSLLVEIEPGAVVALP